MHRTTRNWSLVGLAMAAIAASSASAEPLKDRAFVRPNVSALRASSIERPHRVDAGDLKHGKAQWTRDGLALTEPTEQLAKLGIEEYGIPVYDPESEAWYVIAQGCLVRIDGDGKLPVILDDMQARDVDVRANRGLAVTREKDDTIVLHRFSGGEHTRKVLLRGEFKFYPRFSKDGSKIVVSESRGPKGYMMLVDLEGRVQELGQGYQPTWHPDGERIVFTRTEHDWEKVTRADIFIKDIKTGKEKKVATTESPAATKPALSPDGKAIAFSDGWGDGVFVAPFTVQE